ncbi:hypothetical protein BT96DRAFT_974014 [Gymnopus androsaceus JB14]|uniref:Protein kinase domain-containing protein n=1 Tax=Gymnopus androsaceus JB14 TaxID=1447944 RepID=A0A6A4HXJ2_9AGAR|nr:hypothetical protein BT96DRAFT_974014 [Gymnopus androsaceus JB14]
MNMDMQLISKLDKWPSYHPARNVTDLLACEAPPFNECAVPKEFVNVVITETLSAHRHSTVYGAHFTNKDGVAWDIAGERVKVAVKIGSLYPIALETKVYCAMQPIQGRVIPRMFVFLRADNGTEEGLGCLIIERFGKAVNMPLDMLERSEKVIILSHLQNMHNMGFIHRDLDSRNVLYRDEEFRIIDLEDMTVNHHKDCKVFPSLLDFAVAPAYFQQEVNDYICGTLIRQARETLRFWDDDIACVRDFKIKKGPDIPTERLMASLFPMFMVYYYTKGPELKDMIEEYFRRIQKLVSEGYTYEKLEAVALDVMEQVRADARARCVISFSRITTPLLNNT